ncbi:MAG: aspartate aminotransferase family protein, partial [Rhodospirillaceae bacterium]
ERKQPVAPPTKHEDWYELAGRVLPGAGLGGYSLSEEVRFVIQRGEGAKLFDTRGHEYIDYVGGAGALILGHAHPMVIDAAKEQAGKGIHYFGTLNEQCILLAELLVKAIPCAEKIAYCTTGSEATFYAMRIARAYSGKDKVLKLEGGYHGNHDYSCFSVTPAGLSNYPVGQPDTAGMPSSLKDSVLIGPYNDLDTIKGIVASNHADLAAIILEPVQRIIFPKKGFLEGLRELCDEFGILLIFDEVVTGFRLAYGGAQEYFGVLPDIAAYGKIIGGGGPVGCVAGKSEIMEQCNPVNRGKSNYAYINGTLHGNPLGCAAGIATLKVLREPRFYEMLHAHSEKTLAACQEVLDKKGIPARVIGNASLWQIVFMDKDPEDFSDFIHADMARSRAFDMLQMHEGLYVLPNVRRFVSGVHTEDDLEQTVDALGRACDSL